MSDTDLRGSMGRTTIQLDEETADRLHGRKERGDSYDDVVRRLLDRVAEDDDSMGDGEVRGSASTTTGDSEPVDVGRLTFDRDLTRERREVLVAWLDHARALDEGVTKSDFEGWWNDERQQKTGYGAGSYWEAFAKAAMKQTEAFDKPNARTYRWVGE